MNRIARFFFIFALSTLALPVYAEPIKGPLSDTEKRNLAQMPRGVILMWNRTVVPEGWAICDGTNGTPDLKQRFVRGTTDPKETGNTAGNDQITLSISGTTSNSAESNGDPWGWSDDARRDLTPQASGLGHTHRFSGSASQTILPSHTVILFIMKVKAPGRS